MSAKSWPKIKKVTNHGKTVFLADARIAGKGERRFFPTKGEAETWGQIQRVRRQNQGGAAFDDAELAKFGLTIADAIRFTLEHYRRQAASVPVATAVAALMDAKQSAGMSGRYLDDLRSRLGKLTAAFPDTALGAITTPQLDAFLSRLPGAAMTRNSTRRVIGTLWNYGEVQGWCFSKVATATAKAKAVSAPVETLTVEQLSSILHACDSDTLPGVVIAAFCGLRQAELEKLDWSAVDIGEGIVTVDARIAKTSGRRTVMIPENAVEWLRPYCKKSGKVVPSNFRRLFDRVRVLTGFLPSFLDRKDGELQNLLAAAKKQKRKLTPWPANVLRHSAISYKLAKTRDIAHVATESGNSPAIIRSHYLELVKPSAAVAFFAIMPSKPQNIVSIAV